jgi:NADH-quinone oxidoreductase subunit E
MTQHRRIDFRSFHFAGAEGVLIPLLQEAQAADGYISRAAMEEIHRRSGIPLAHVYGVATFYAQFRLSPVGRHLVKVCHGTACHVAGAREITEALETELGVATGTTTADGLYTLETVACLGCCSLAPVITIGAETHGGLDTSAARRALRQHRRGAGEAAATATQADGAGSGAAATAREAVDGALAGGEGAAGATGR